MRVEPREAMPFAERAKIALTIGIIAGACTFGFGLPLGAFGFGAAAVANAAVTSALVGMFFSLATLLPHRRIIHVGHGHRAPLFTSSHAHHSHARGRVHVAAPAVSHTPGYYPSRQATHAQSRHVGSHPTRHIQTPLSTNHGAGSTQRHVGSHPMAHRRA